MSKLPIILSAVLTLTLLVLVAPGILAMNRGKILRNIALWLAIILGLALIYQTFGPGKNQFFPNQTSETDENYSDSANTSSDAEDQNYTPPKD